MDNDLKTILAFDINACNDINILKDFMDTYIEIVKRARKNRNNESARTILRKFSKDRQKILRRIGILILDQPRINLT